MSTTQVWALRLSEEITGLSYTTTSKWQCCHWISLYLILRSSLHWLHPYIVCQIHKSSSKSGRPWQWWGHLSWRMIGWWGRGAFLRHWLSPLLPSLGTWTQSWSCFLKKISIPAEAHSSVWTSRDLWHSCFTWTGKTLLLGGKELHGFRSLPTHPLEAFFFLVPANSLVFQRGKLQKWSLL